MGPRQSSLIGMFNGEMAHEYLDKDFPELPGGQVIKEWVEDGAEVEEGVSNMLKCDIAPKVGSSPARLGPGGHHKATNLVGKPAHHQRSHNETKKNDGLLPGCLDL